MRVCIMMTTESIRQLAHSDCRDVSAYTPTILVTHLEVTDIRWILYPRRELHW